MKSIKEERQSVISDIISKSSVNSQDELLLILKDKGFELTQATLSRDFREMKISKTPDINGNYIYRLPGMHLPESKSEKYGIVSQFYRQGVINIEFSAQFGVIKTPKGYAKGIASDIEANNISGIMGIISDDNSVLLILREGVDKINILNALKMLFAS